MWLKWIFVGLFLTSLGPAVIALSCAQVPPRAEVAIDEAVIYSDPVLGSKISVHVSKRFAGSVDSLRWRGKEFIDSSDHGREMQFAASFEHKGECFNPTEAGSQSDASDRNSSSEYSVLYRGSDRVISRNKMAYWLSGEEVTPACYGASSSPKTKESEFVLNKEISFCHYAANVMLIDYTLLSPPGVRYGHFEAPTGYMPIEFASVATIDVLTGVIKESGPDSMNDKPIIVYSADKKYALGVFGRIQGGERPDSESYGFRLFRGAQHPVSKWDVFYKIEKYVPSKIHFLAAIVVGDMPTVITTMRAIELCVS